MQIIIFLLSVLVTIYNIYTNKTLVSDLSKKLKEYIILRQKKSYIKNIKLKMFFKDNKKK
jgi:hypothetical protein